MNQEHLPNLCGLNGADGQRNKPSPDRSPSRLTLGQFSEPRLLIPRLLSDRQDRAIRELVKRLEATNRINHAPAFLEAVLNREAEFPTFIEGVAVPHARGGAVQQLSFAVGLSAPGIPWGRDQSRIAHAVFLFAIPLREAQTYVWLLSGLSALIQDERAFMALRRATQPEQMLKILHEVRAGRSASSTVNRGAPPLIHQG